MSEEQDLQPEEINEDLIYQQMFEAITEELHLEENSEEETPNLDSLSLSQDQIKQIKDGGIQIFKEIMQARFRQKVEEDLKLESQNELISSAQLQGNIQSQLEGDSQNQQVENIITNIQNEEKKQIQEISQQQVNKEDESLINVASKESVEKINQSTVSLHNENEKQSSPQNNQNQVENQTKQSLLNSEQIQTSSKDHQNINDNSQSNQNQTLKAPIQINENQELNNQVQQVNDSSATNIENQNTEIKSNLNEIHSNPSCQQNDTQNDQPQQDENQIQKELSQEKQIQVQQNSSQSEQKEQDSLNLKSSEQPTTEVLEDNQIQKSQENNQSNLNDCQQHAISPINNQNEIYNQQICEQDVEYSINSISQNHVEKEKKQYKDQLDPQLIQKNSTEIAQIQESVKIPMEDTQDNGQFIAERENSTEKNEETLRINSESISPIAKRDKFQESNFIGSNQGITLSTQNSAQKEAGFNMTNSNDKQQAKKSNKIINDIFSLSGIKVGQFKSMTPITNNSVNMTSSNNNPRKFNQSSLTQYQYDSISSLRPRSPKEQDSHIARLYQKKKDVEEKIKKLQEEKITQELSTLKPHTSITKGSQKILSKTNYFKPSEISQIVQKEKIEKRQQLLEEKQRDKIDQELQKCTFHPQLIAKNIDEHQYRSVDEYYNNQQEWLQNKDKYIVSQQMNSIQKQLSETTFHPKINKQSQSQIRNLKVEEKLIQDQEKVIEKRKKMVEQNQPLFKPVILPKSQELAKKRKEKEFMPCFEISSKYN